MISSSFVGAIAVEGSEFSGTGRTTVIGAVNCTGNESNILDCPYETLPTTCGGGVAGIICQGKQKETHVTFS